MSQALMSIRECDRRLAAVHLAYLDAIDHGDILSAETAYELLDELLDIRLHLPQQRTGT